MAGDERYDQTHDQTDDELAALLALDALPADEQADAELRHGTFPQQYRDIVGVLAEASAAAPPAELRARTLERALARRSAGRPVDPPADIDARTAYGRTTADLYALLLSLDEAEWAARAHEEHGTVHDLVAHLTGIERFTAAWLDPAAPPPVDPHIEHVESTRPLVRGLREVPPRELAEGWYGATQAVLAGSGTGDPARTVSFHDMSSTVDGLLVMRTFELWAHAMDVALATGRPMPKLDDERMALLSRRLMAALPRALAARRTALPERTARFVLTGPAGGCYILPLDPRGTAGDPDVTIVVDTVDLCRIAARRLSPDEVHATLDGDEDVARVVLAAADAFARD